ncbi:MAG: YggT family protein [Blastocatellia bacterium]
MLEDEKLAVDESERIAEHEAVKREARKGVHAEIADQADRLDERDKARAAEVGDQLKQKAITEVADTEAELDRARGVARISQVVDYLFYIIYGLIGLEILLDLLGARDSNAFKNLIDRLNAPLLAPFRGLMPDPSSGRFQLRISYIVALIVYVLLHLAINGLLRLIAHRKTAV